MTKIGGGGGGGGMRNFSEDDKRFLIEQINANIKINESKKSYLVIQNLWLEILFFFNSQSSCQTKVGTAERTLETFEV